MKILVTGGAGYIGSQTTLELVKQGFDVTVLDSYELGYHQALERIEQMTGKTVGRVTADLRKIDEVHKAFENRELDAIVHFAAYKNVGEAEGNPEKYFENNVLGSLNLLKTMEKNGVKRIVFSSTSAVYGNSEVLPMDESLPFAPLNAYGQSKATVEWMLGDFYRAYDISSVALRYFNAAGADPSGEIGEDPSRTGNIIPLIMQTLIGKRESFSLFGDNFETADGTQERDYIHVQDLATGHVAALRKLEKSEGAFAYNLGRGESTSNKQLIELAEEITGKKLNYEVTGPRAGDPPITVSDPSKAEKELDWKAVYDIRAIMTDHWRWVSQNPEGYDR